MEKSIVESVHASSIHRLRGHHHVYALPTSAHRASRYKERLARQRECGGLAVDQSGVGLLPAVLYLGAGHCYCMSLRGVGRRSTWAGNALRAWRCVGRGKGGLERDQTFHTIDCEHQIVSIRKRRAHQVVSGEE